MTEVEDEEEDCTPAHQWSWISLVGMVFNLAGNVLRAGSQFCEEVDETLAAHIEWQDDRQKFAKSVLWDIDHIDKANHK